MPQADYGNEDDYENMGRGNLFFQQSHTENEFEEDDRMPSQNTHMSDYPKQMKTIFYDDVQNGTRQDNPDYDKLFSKNFEVAIDMCSY
jgi:hypothetical protein